MRTTTKRDEPSQRADAAKKRGAPPTYAAHAVRKDVTVRVSVKSPQTPETEELREHGYGHGV
jgi:hypothetical protein